MLKKTLTKKVYSCRANDLLEVVADVKSYTNFAFFKTGVHIDEFSKYFKEKGILVGRPFPPYYDWCRISTGRIEDVERFAEVLRKYYS